MANWYVDNAASGSNNGTSWVNAWESFASIAWGSVGPGDAIYLSGGSVTKTYNETFAFGAGGSSLSSMVNLDVGANSLSPSGHDGQVIINGGSYGIDIYNRDYCAVNGSSEGVYKLHLQNQTVYNVRVRDTSYSHVDNVSIANTQSRGFQVQTGQHCRIRGCDIRTGNISSNSQTDSIYLQFGNDNIVENNVIVLGNTTSSQHIDAIQAANNEDRLTVRGNYLAWTNGRGNATCQTLIIEDFIDWCRIYNNVIVGCSENYLTVLLKRTFGGLYYFWNNIVVSQDVTGGTAVWIDGLNAEIGAVQNNILVAPNGYPIRTYQSIVPTSKVDHNCLYRVSGSDVSRIASPRTWAQHQAAGYDANGINVDPEYNSADEYRPLDATAPTIDAGMDLSGNFTTDRDGETRSALWDMGAYESIGEAPEAPDPPANVSATDGAHTDKVAITWDASEGATHYRVYRNTVDNPSTATPLGLWQTGLTYDDTTAIVEIVYYYWVEAALSDAGASASGFSSSDTGYRVAEPDPVTGKTIMIC